MNEFKFKINRGTPKTMEEAINNGLEDCLGQTKAAAISVMHANIKDFLAQKFQTPPEGFETEFHNFFHNVLFPTTFQEEINTRLQKIYGSGEGA